MANDKVICSTAKISAIADAIREKASLTSPLLLDDMPEAILHIPSGGGEDDGLVKYVEYTGGRGLFAYTSVTDAELEMLPLNQLNITDGYRLFSNCTTLTTIPAALDLSNCTNLEYAFYGCTGLTNIPERVVTGLNNVTNLNYTFYNCTNLTGSYVFDLERATTLSQFLYGSKIENITVKLHTVNPLIQYFLSGVSTAKNVTLDFCDTSNPKCYSSNSDSYSFINCNCTLDSVTLKGLSKWNNTIFPILSSSTYAKSVTIDGFKGGGISIKNKNTLASQDPGVETLTYRNCTFTTLSYFCYGYKSLQQLNIENCTFNAPTSTEYMFGYTGANNENFDWTILDSMPLQTVTNMNYMFYNSGYDGYNMANFIDYSKVIYANNAFNGSKIKRIPPNFNLSACGRVANIFSNCTELVEVGNGLELGTQVTETVWATVGSWFSGCTKLKKVPRLNWWLLSRCGYGNESYYYRMFYNCSSLDRIDVGDKGRMRESDFEGCTSLKCVVSRLTNSASGTKFTWNTKAFNKTPIATSTTEGFIYVPKEEKYKYPVSSSLYNVSFTKIRPFISLGQGGYYVADPTDDDLPFDPATQEVVLLDLDEYLKAELDENDEYVISEPQIITTLSQGNFTYISDKNRETIGLFVRNK